MTDKVADVLLARLREWGVKQVFGNSARPPTALP